MFFLALALGAGFAAIILPALIYAGASPRGMMRFAVLSAAMGLIIATIQSMLLDDTFSRAWLLQGKAVYYRTMVTSHIFAFGGTICAGGLAIWQLTPWSRGSEKE